MMFVGPAWCDYHQLRFFPLQHLPVVGIFPFGSGTLRGAASSGNVRVSHPYDFHVRQPVEGRIEFVAVVSVAGVANDRRPPWFSPARHGATSRS
jgi:hypothetical protein